MRRGNKEQTFRKLRVDEEHSSGKNQEEGMAEERKL